MTQLALVALGGAFGSVLRYLVGIAIVRLTGPAFPFNTVFVNVVGSFVMGVVVALLLKLDVPAARVTNLRLLIAVGVLGGFTTFSSFSADVAALWEKDAFVWCAVYVLGSVTLSIAAVFVGLSVVRRIAG